MLTFSQRRTLQNFILADSVLGPWGQQNTDASQKQIQANLNSTNSPNFTVFKGFASLLQIAQQMDAAETANLVQADHARLQTFTTLFFDGVSPTDPFKPHVYLQDIFSAQPITRGRLGNANNVPGTFWKRLATRLEKLFATGTGSDPLPATLAMGDGMLVDGPISQQEISDTLAGI